MDPARRYLRTFAVVLGTALLAIALLNWAVNPYSYYPSAWLRPLTWSTRPLRTEALSGCRGVGALIIGSSRSMKLAPAQLQRLTGLRALNASVDSAMAEDFLALLRLARAGCGGSVKEVVLGIDLEAFHDTQGPDGRITGAPAYWAQLPLPERLRSAAAATEKLLAWEQTVQSLRSLRMLREPLPTPTSRFDDDGFLHYVAWEAQKADGTFKLDTSGQVQAYLSRFAGFKHLSHRRLAVLRTFLEETASDGVRVRGFVTPLHADVLAALRSQRGFDALRSELNAQLADLQREFPHFTAFDASEVSAYGGAPDGFWDGAHVDDESSALLLDGLYGRRGDAVQ